MKIIYSKRLVLVHDGSAKQREEKSRSELLTKDVDKNSCSLVDEATSIGKCLTLILRRSRTGTVWFYTSTSNKRAARLKLYTKSLTRDLKLMYSRLTLVRISINL